MDYNTESITQIAQQVAETRIKAEARAKDNIPPMP